MMCIYIHIYIYTWQVFVTFWGMVKWLLQWSFDLQIGAKKVTLNHLACTNICTFVYVYIFKCSKTKRTLIISITPHADFYQYIFGGDSPILNHQARRVIWWILRQEVTWFYHEMTIYSQITCWEWDQLGWIHPGRLTWNLRIHLWKRKIIFQTIIFRFYVNLPGCMFHPLRTWIAIHHHTLTADIECSGGRDIKALSKKTKTSSDLTLLQLTARTCQEANHQKENFSSNPSEVRNYWFQGGYSTVLANQRFADDTNDQKGTTHSYSHLYSVFFISISERTNKNKGC